MNCLCGLNKRSQVNCSWAKLCQKILLLLQVYLGICLSLPMEHNNSTQLDTVIGALRQVEILLAQTCFFVFFFSLHSVVYFDAPFALLKCSLFYLTAVDFGKPVGSSFQCWTLLGRLKPWESAFLDLKVHCAVPETFVIQYQVKDFECFRDLEKLHSI